jgi:putative endonuclease
MFRWQLLHRDHSDDTREQLAQHNAGTFEGFTKSCTPVTLVFSHWFDRITDAIVSERKLKKWGRAKKEAFIRGDIALLQQLAKPKSSHPPRRSAGPTSPEYHEGWRRRRVREGQNGFIMVRNCFVPVSRGEENAGTGVKNNDYASVTSHA